VAESRWRRGRKCEATNSVNLDKPLSVSSGFEASHSSLPFTRRLVRVLSSVVQIPVLPGTTRGITTRFAAP
jgi:hypothetical protein